LFQRERLETQGSSNLSANGWKTIIEGLFDGKNVQLYGYISPRRLSSDDLLSKIGAMTIVIIAHRFQTSTEN
jgi:hypothetical protein